LAGFRVISLDLPLRADIPTDYDSVRRVVCEDPSPATLAAVDALVVHGAAFAQLEDRLGDIDTKHVVLGRLEPAKAFGEDRERALDRRLDDDVVADGR